MNLDRQPLRPIHRAFPDIAYAPCKSWKTPVSRHEAHQIHETGFPVLLPIDFLDYPKRKPPYGSNSDAAVITVAPLAAAGMTVAIGPTSDSPGRCR
jgi:hypothetical protein